MHIWKRFVYLCLVYMYSLAVEVGVDNKMPRPRNGGGKVACKWVEYQGFPVSREGRRGVSMGLWAW